MYVRGRQQLSFIPINSQFAARGGQGGSGCP